ncbi:MAG: hypothetical protein ACOVQM_01425, partial [Pirellula sp.]
KAITESIAIDGLNVKHYVLPTLANDTKIRDSYYVLSKGQLLAADDLETIKDLVKAQSGVPTGALSQSDLYKNVQSKIERDEHPSEIEYFVQPIGFGKLLRSVSGKQAKSQVDILKLLEGQGFDRILCAAGSVQLNKTDLDMHHQGFILRE